MCACVHGDGLVTCLGCITASSQVPAGTDSRTLVTLIRKQKMDDGQGVFLSFSWCFPQG